MSSLRDNKIIEHISFLRDGQRTVVKASEKGTFRIPVSSVIEGRLKTTYKNLTASELIAHPSIVSSDPVMTLKSGDKVRVFDGGDSSYLPAMSQGIIERHDRVELLRRKFEKKKQALREKEEKRKKLSRESKKTPIVPPFSPYIAGTTKKNPNDTDEYDNPFYWDDDNDGLF